ncbi:ABC transporter ATP-binding protein [Leifsonia aquatica]|uniref:ABC transporter ATP-binding protein n=1 Tax=Leifsonia aquatica TaxID=144185 RepID=UPI000469A3B6|nr:ABC transporter ATP-binding protein [Leifsonia aquatica]
MAEAPTDTTLPIATPRRVRAVVAGLLRRHRSRSIAVALLFLAASGVGLVMPAGLGRIVDAVSSGAGLPTIAGWLGVVAGGAIGAVGLSLWGARMLTALVQEVLARLREDVFASAMRLPASTVDDGESADLVSRVTGDVDAVAEAGGTVVPTVLSATFAIAVSVVAFAALDPWLALAGIACVPFYLVGTRAFLRRSRVVFREVRAREAARSQAVIEAVEGVETLTALNEQRTALDRVDERAEESIRVQIEGVRLRNRLFRWINGGEAFGLAALLATGFVLHASGAISIGTVTTAALVFHRLFDPIGQLIFGLDDVQRATIGLARLVGVIDLAPAASPAPPTTASGSRHPPAGIDLHDVEFRYPTSGLGVGGVTLRVEPGTTAAFVGTSGSGKSTLARVIAGHFVPSSGRLRLDHPTIPYYISQELHHFRGSVADNLRLAAPDAGQEQIAAALAAVGADWAIPAAEPVAQPTSVAQPGRPTPAVALDEGRIQQLAVARALLADPSVVILDEATADVGLQHRDAVEAAIGALRQGRTAVVIAHRLEQASTADQIVVFADGAVAQRGTHSELLAANGPYRSFWRAQYGASGHASDAPSTGRPAPSHVHTYPDRTDTDTDTDTDTETETS